MYNEELKRKFIEEEALDRTQRVRMNRIFGDSERFEESFGMDLCLFPEDELSVVVNTVINARSSTKSVERALLRRYLKWCARSGMDVKCVEPPDISITDSVKMAAQMVSGPEMLQERLDLVFRDIVNCEVDNQCRGLYWLAFIGLSENDIEEVSTSDVDMRTRTIHYDDKDFHMYDESIPVIRYLCTANSFVFDCGRYVRVVERAPGNKLLRGVRESSVNRRSIEHTANRRIKASGRTDFSLNFKALRASGMYYRMYIDEINNGAIDYRKYADMQFGDEKDVSESRRAMRLVEIKKDYKYWKGTFNKQIFSQ